MRSLMVCLSLLLALTLVEGCRRRPAFVTGTETPGGELISFSPAPITLVYGESSSDAVRTALARALEARRWTLETSEAGRVVAHFEHRGALVQIAIDFGETQLSITCLHTDGLAIESVSSSRRYDGYLRNLTRSIEEEIGRPAREAAEAIARAEEAERNREREARDAVAREAERDRRERIETERLATERERLAADRARAERDAERDRVLAPERERLAAERERERMRIEADRLAAERAASERARYEADRTASERARWEAERAERDRRAAGSRSAPVVVTALCTNLRAMEWLAYNAGDRSGSPITDAILERERGACDLGLEASSRETWSSGQPLLSGSSWYYPNGQPFHSGSAYYYPNGQPFQSGSNFYYPNGQLLLSGGRFYAYDGASSSESALISESVGRLSRDRTEFLVARYRTNTGFWAMIYLSAMVVESR